MYRRKIVFGSQKRLNDVAILHIHRNEFVDIDHVANSFINKTKVHQNTFEFKNVS